MGTKLRTLQEAREWFHETGTPISDWACAHGFNRAMVYAVLNARAKCYRGEAHRIAVALEIKAPTNDTIEEYMAKRNPGR